MSSLHYSYLILSFCTYNYVTFFHRLISLSLGFFLKSKEELHYIKDEYIIKIHTALSKYSRTKQLQNSIPNLCKKSNKRPHMQTLSKQAKNKHPKNGDQHPPVGCNEHNLLFPFCVFLLPLSATDEEERPI